MDDAPDTTLIHRETRTLVALILIASAAFVGTRAVAHANQSRRQRDADAWFSRGQESLRRHDAPGAVRELRRAAVLDPSNAKVRLELGAALTAAGATAEAQRVLLEARAAAPESADVNLALGRLAASGSDTGTAINAYQAALNNLWRPDEALARYQVRVELARYLLAHDQRSRALSELLIISAEMPDTAAAHEDLGGMLAAAAEPGRALTQLERAVALEPTNQQVHFAAGQAALALGDDRRALRLLRAAADIPQAQHLSATITFALSWDPLLPRLTAAERERRLRAGLDQARTRLDRCGVESIAAADAGGPPLRDQLTQFEASLTPKARRRGPPVVDLLDDGVDLIARIETATTACGPSTLLDQALMLIGRRHPGRS